MKAWKGNHVLSCFCLSTCTLYIYCVDVFKMYVCSEDTVKTRLHYVGVIVYFFSNQWLYARFPLQAYPDSAFDGIRRPTARASQKFMDLWFCHLQPIIRHKADRKSPQKSRSLEMARNTPLRAPKNEDREHFGHTSHMFSVSFYFGSSKLGGGN